MSCLGLTHWWNWATAFEQNALARLCIDWKWEETKKKKCFGNNAGSETYLQIIDKALLYIDLENTGVTYWCYIELGNDSSSYIKERWLYITQRTCDLSAMSKSVMAGYTGNNT